MGVALGEGTRRFLWWMVVTRLRWWVFPCFLHQASEELQFAPLDPTLPFTPIVLEGFKSPTGPAQDDFDDEHLFWWHELGGGFKYVVIFHPYFGEEFQFDYSHIFQQGWNHQPVRDEIFDEITVKKRTQQKHLISRMLEYELDGTWHLGHWKKNLKASYKSRELEFWDWCWYGTPSEQWGNDTKKRKNQGPVKATD